MSGGKGEMMNQLLRGVPGAEKDFFLQGGGGCSAAEERKRTDVDLQQQASFYVLGSCFQVGLLLF